jgi:hypothetical protein
MQAANSQRRTTYTALKEVQKPVVRFVLGDRLRAHLAGNNWLVSGCFRGNLKDYSGTRTVQNLTQGDIYYIEPLQKYWIFLGPANDNKGLYWCLLGRPGRREQGSEDRRIVKKGSP